MMAYRLPALTALLLVLVGCSGAGGPAGPAAGARPDFSGVWMAFAVENPDGGGNAPRYSPEGEAKLDAFRAQFRSVPETGVWCLGLGMPHVMMSLVSYPIQIVQTDSIMVMLAELEMQVRRVYLDGRPHDPELLPSSAGHSIGTWDGDTLVIDTTQLTEWNVRPWPRSEEAHFVERMYMTRLQDIEARPSGFVTNAGAPLNDDVLVFEMTFTDPAYYAGPQRRKIYYQRMPDTATMEYQCTTELWIDELEKQRITP